MVYHTIFEKFPYGVLLLGTSFEKCNEQACKQFACGRKDILGCTLLDFSPSKQPNGKNSVKKFEHYSAKVLSGTSQVFSWQVLRKDNTKIDTEISMKSIDIEGRGSLLLIIRDITGEKTLNRKLLEQIKRSPVASFYADAEGVFLYVNAKWCEITGFTRAKALKKRLDCGIHPDDRERVLEEWCAAKGQSVLFQSKYRMLHTNGSVYWVFCQIMADKDENGRWAGYVGTIADITSLREVERNLKANEETVRLILNSTAEGIYGLDLNGQCTFCSPSALRLLGYEAQNELLGKNMHELIHHSHLDGKPYPVEECKACLASRNGKISHVEDEVFWRKDGTSFSVEYHSSPMKKKGETIGSVVAFLDISGRKEAERVLRERNAFIQTITDNLPIGFEVITWPGGKVLYQNNKVEEILGWTKQKFTNREFFYENILADLDLASRNELRRRVDTALASGDPARMSLEFRISRSSGERADILAVYIPMFEKGLLLITIQDITGRKRAESEILKLNQELEARVVERTRELELATQEMEAFTYSVSHDLRVPLRAIDGFSEALLEDYQDKLDEDGKNFLRYLHEGSRDMSDLIDGLLKLSRSTRGEMVREPVDIATLVEGVVKSLRKAEPERQVDVHIAQNLKADADPRLLKAVMENLLGNAWKYTAKTAEGSIVFGAEPQEGETVFFVRDNGAGFDMAYADKLFLPFQRLHKTGEFSGTGIGLATVQRIIHRHGGRIWAKGVVGKGATFYFTLEPERNPLG